MGATVTLRSRSSQTLGAVMMGLAGLVLLATAVDSATTLLRYGAPVVLFGLAGWAAFWRPGVEVSDGGVTVVNTLRTVHVPWPAIESVDGRYGLRLRTAYGPISAWGAGAPAGRGRAVEDQSEVAREVLKRLEELRAAGYLDGARLERPEPEVTWHLPVVAALAVVAVAWVVLLILT